MVDVMEVKMMENKKNKTRWLGLVVFLVFLLTMFSVSIVSGNSISVDSSIQTISGGKDFTVNVSCVPSQPIKAFEFRVSFNPTLLRANNVTEGNFFNNFTTFFNPGTINNNAGTIIDIYSLIVGSGNVSSNGTLVTISFTAKDNSGTSPLTLNAVGICDDGGYLSFNVSDSSINVQGSGGGGGGGYPPPSGGGSIPEPLGNVPPNPPLIPSGPIFIEMGVEYEYSSVTIDPDGDHVRYRFYWGDGNMSNWSDYVYSNTSVNMSYSWNSIDTFSIGVIAQDENGLNSSWSLPLNVTVLQFDLEGNYPVADFQLPQNISINQTILFDASLSFDNDGAIISYFWDFGDGETGMGINTTHVYEKPGEYQVILVVTDNNGNRNNKTLTINVGLNLEGAVTDEQFLNPLHLGIILIGAAAVILVCILIRFRDNIIVSLTYHKSRPISHHTTHESNKKIKRIDTKIEKIRRKMEHY